MNRINQTLKFYQKTFMQAFNYFTANPIFMMVGAVMIIAIYIAEIITAPLPLFGYLIRAVVKAAAFSSYLYITTRASHGYKVDWDDVKIGLSVHTRVILGIIILNNFIMIVLVQFLFVPLFVLITYLLLLVFVMNALPEVVSNKHYYVIDSLKYTIAFERQHALTWYLPNIIFAIAYQFAERFLKSHFYLPVDDISVKLAASIIFFLLVGQFIGGILMLFRQLLFRQLDSGEYKHRFHVVK